MEILPLSDCEAISDGLLLQPVNTVTALAYVAAGAWVLWRTRASARGWLPRAYGAGLALVGVGSVLLHGFGGLAAQRAHDASLMVLAGLLVAIGVRAWRDFRRATGAAVWTGVTAFALAVPFQVFGRTGGPLCAAGTIPSHGIWHMLTAVALAAAGVAADRTAR